MATKKTQLQIVKPPTYLQVKEGELGTENIDQTDIQVPRLKIVQATSTVKQINNNLADGDLYNSLTGESYGNTLNIYILFHWKSRIWFSDELKLIAAIYKDPNSGSEIAIGDTDYATNNPDEGKDSHNYLVIPVKDIENAIRNKEIPFPMIFSCISAAIKYARQLNGKLKTNSFKRIPIYGQQVKVTTELVKFTKGQAYMPLFSFGEYAPQNHFALLTALYKNCKTLISKPIVVEDTDVDTVKSVSVDDDNIPF